MKLVRDRIPEIICANGEIPITRRVKGDDYVRLLGAKVLEEAEELWTALMQYNKTAVLEELSDVLEAVEALRAAVGPKRVDRCRAKKLLKRGGFASGIVLLETRPAPKQRKRKS